MTTMVHGRNLAIAVLTAAGLALGAGSAVASPGAPTQVTCDGSTLTVVTPSGNDGNNWGAARVVDGGHLVVASLEYAAYDDTAGVSLEDEVLSHGAAHENQQRVTCLVASETATLGDLAPAGFSYPPGTAPTDLVTFSLRAVVVPRPSALPG
jgi:hypothetical protein